ncbi:ANTAR domain-containing response regulator [Lentzea sp. HUAS12]|uniref:ANTAR domain-containing response regulator n=1 Tax=Lentzea sp. HUAS12 TaxID=2951806 RepID=UPI0020A0FC39|nr:ANTAR domain-containing protein [Lentzea sp. HUAS12]USX56468.1 ANTAR domain-containing protein [Lentzea sp. HUAS12]
MQQIIDTAAASIPFADVVSLTLRSPDGAVFTPVHTAVVAAELDEVQYRTGEVPCVDAADLTGPAHAASDDLTTEERWPQFAAAAVQAGYRSVHSTALLLSQVADQPTGALNIYLRGNHRLDDPQRHTALLLAMHASLALAHARNAELARLHKTQLRKAIDSRDVIGQAKGILMQRQGITADEAFSVLRTTSQHLNVKLVEIARNLVDHRTELDT